MYNTGNSVALLSTHTHIYIHTYKHTHTYIYIYIHTYKHTHIYIYIYINTSTYTCTYNIHMTASTQADFTPLKLMVPGFVSWVHLALEGARTNVFGWGCPLYWTQPSLSILCLVFVIGLILGASLCLLAIWTFWTSFGHLITPSAAAAQGSISRNPRYSAPTEHLYEFLVRRRQGHWAGLQAGCSPYHCAWASWACCELHQGHLLQGPIIHLFFATSSVSQRALLIWFQRVVLLLSLLVSLRQGTRLQQLWSLPPVGWFINIGAWKSQESLVGGPVSFLWLAAGFILQTAALNWIFAQGSTWCSEPLAWKGQLSISQPSPTGKWSATSPPLLQSPTPSRLSRKPRFSWLELGLPSTTPINDDGLYGCYGWSAGYERRGVGDHQHGALRACMASWTDRGWRCRERSAAPYEASRWHFARYAGSFSSSRVGASWQSWRRRRHVWAIPSLHSPVSDSGWRGGLSNRNRCRRLGGRLLAKSPQPYVKADDSHYSVPSLDALMGLPVYQTQQHSTPQTRSSTSQRAFSGETENRPQERLLLPSLVSSPRGQLPHHPPWRSKGFQSFCQRFLHSWSTSHSAVVCVSACGWEASRTGSSGIRKAGPCSRIIPDRRLLLGTCMSWSNQEHWQR